MCAELKELILAVTQKVDPSVIDNQIIKNDIGVLQTIKRKNMISEQKMGCGCSIICVYNDLLSCYKVCEI